MAYGCRREEITKKSSDRPRLRDLQVCHDRSQCHRAPEQEQQDAVHAKEGVLDRRGDLLPTDTRPQSVESILFFMLSSMDARKNLRQALVGPRNHELLEIQVAPFPTHAAANLRSLDNCRERGCQRINILGWNQ